MAGWKHDKRTPAERGYGWTWRKLRNRVMVRDDHLCAMCLQSGKLTEANQVDHIKPKHLGGTDEPANLQCLCITHHNAKTYAENRGKDYQSAGASADGTPIDPLHHWNL